MKWYLPPKPPKPNKGDRKRVKKFALFPKTFNTNIGFTRIWLEYYVVTYEWQQDSNWNYYWHTMCQELVPDKEIFDEKFERKLK